MAPIHSLPALLYAGAALVGALLRRPPEREARVRRTDAPRLILMAIFGAGLGPVALAWGLQYTSGTSASLMLTLEAVFTAVLARLWYHETLDTLDTRVTRVTLAMFLLTFGGVLLVLDRTGTGIGQIAGLLAVMVATAAWGVDNSLSRTLADRDPGQVVMIKGAIGAFVTTTILAVAFGEPVLSPWQAVALLLIGATGYGLSLRFYLLAQRAFGAARTGSVFAFAPFVGAIVAVAMGEKTGSVWMLARAALMVSGIVLHLAERHAHALLDHEHAHTHDDGHHGHQHDPLPKGAHSHVHQHTPMWHTHEHVPDEHHVHQH